MRSPARAGLLRRERPDRCGTCRPAPAGRQEDDDGIRRRRLQCGNHVRDATLRRTRRGQGNAHAVPRRQVDRESGWTEDQREISISNARRAVGGEISVGVSTLSHPSGYVFGPAHAASAARETARINDRSMIRVAIKRRFHPSPAATLDRFIVRAEPVRRYA